MSFIDCTLYIKGDLATILKYPTLRFTGRREEGFLLLKAHLKEEEAYMDLLRTGQGLGAHAEVVKLRYPLPHQPDRRRSQPV